MAENLATKKFDDATEAWLDRNRRTEPLTDDQIDRVVTLFKRGTRTDEGPTAA